MADSAPVNETGRPTPVTPDPTSETPESTATYETLQRLAPAPPDPVPSNMPGCVRSIKTISIIPLTAGLSAVVGWRIADLASVVLQGDAWRWVLDRKSVV